MYPRLRELYFLLAFACPALVFAQIPGTNGLFDCEINDKGRKQIVTYKQPNEFVDPIKKKVNKKNALNLMQSKVRPTQRKVILQSVRLSRNLRESVQGNSTSIPALSVLSAQDQAIFNNVMSDAKKTGHLNSGIPALTASVSDVLSKFEEIISNQKKVNDDYRIALKQLKNCDGCQNKRTESLGVDSLRKKKSKKRKCGCFTKTVDATLEYRYGNDPTSPNNCQAIGIAKWSSSETKNAKSVEVFYTWNYQGGDLRSKTASPPYDDALPFYDQILTPGEGSHQLVIVRGSASHGNPSVVVDCGEMSAKQQAAVIPPYYVEAEICPFG